MPWVWACGKPGGGGGCGGGAAARGAAAANARSSAAWARVWAAAGARGAAAGQKREQMGTAAVTGQACAAVGGGKPGKGQCARGACIKMCKVGKGVCNSSKVRACACKCVSNARKGKRNVGRWCAEYVGR